VRPDRSGQEGAHGAHNGVDVFGLGALNWTPFQPLEFAAKWNLDVVRNLADVEASIFWTQRSWRRWNATRRMSRR
jgi:hypothetical protein